MRVSLTHKFVVGALAVSAIVIGFPILLAESGIAVAAWMSWFVGRRN